MAAEAGIAVGFEYHRGTFTQTRAGAAALLDAVSRENVSCYWQPNPDISLEEQLLEMVPCCHGCLIFTYFIGPKTTSAILFRKAFPCGNNT